MMKIASVSFHSNPNQIGGAHVPAVAFKEWCDILGVKCDLVFGYEDLYKYDAVFFATPPDERALELKIPYVVMIHAEFDKYNSDVMDRALSIVVIDQTMKYWPFLNQIYWHPCCQPKYLLKGDEVFDDYKKGTLYAARVSTWKNANTLAAYSNLNIFQECYGPVTILGKANKSYYGEFVNSSLSNVCRIDRLFNPDEEILRYQQAEFFWDVSGTRDYRLPIKRLNLAAFEAMKYGCIPIVDKNTVPKALHDFVIDFRSMLDNKVYSKALGKVMLSKAETEYFGYYQVQKMVMEIIRTLENGKMYSHIRY